MTLVSSIVTAALRKLRIVDAAGTPEPAQMMQAIDAMNRMVMRWQANGTQLGFAPASMPDEAISIPIEAESVVIYSLALELGMEYGVQPDVATVNLARAYMADLIRDQFVSAPPRTLGMSSPRADSSWGSRYNVYTDGYNR